MIDRLRDAWAVLTGRATALYVNSEEWAEQNNFVTFEKPKPILRSTASTRYVPETTTLWDAAGNSLTIGRVKD